MNGVMVTYFTAPRNTLVSPLFFFPGERLPENTEGTAVRSSRSRFRAFRLSYAFGFAVFLVTGFRLPQVFLRRLSSSLFFFFESFS
jgi:hypothetical protein